MEENLNEIYILISEKGFSLLAAVAIFIIGKWVLGFFTRGFEKVLKARNVDPTLVDFGRNLLYFAGMSFVVLAALAKMGIQTASFIAVLGAAGLAVGMALQGSLSNFAAGVMIILFRPYTAGDFIDAGGCKGTVKEIQIFNTVLGTPDNVKVILPNSQALSGSITNYSANDTRRVDLVAGVSYQDDVKKAKKVLEEIVSKNPMVLKEPAPTIAVSELADSSVNFVVRPWVKAKDYWAAYFGLTEEIKIGLEANGLTIPFPQQDVYIQSLPSTEGVGSSNAVSAN